MKIKIQTQDVSVELEDEVKADSGSSWAWHKIPETETAFKMIADLAKELCAMKGKDNGLTK